MAEAGDIVGLSIPFTAGVAAAALVPPGPWRCQLCFLAVMAAATAMVVFCLKGRRAFLAALMFFFIGAASLLGDEISSHPSAGWTSGFASGALERLCAAIDSIRFEDSRTAPLVKALLTGKRDSLERQTVQIFRESGASHILALSGLHLGVIYAILGRALAVLGNSRAASAVRSVLIIGASFFYMIMTGASDSIVRAFLFITINETLRHCPSRRRNPLHVLFTALMIQLAFRPASIRSPGFQLSYLAMLGIFTLYARMEKWYPDSMPHDVPRKIWKSLALSLSCQTFTAPLVWARFHTFPKYFFMTNLLALPITELFMVSSVICVTGAVAGWCPDIMKSPVDLLARTLLFCLETVSAM